MSQTARITLPANVSHLTCGLFTSLINCLVCTVCVCIVFSGNTACTLGTEEIEVLLPKAHYD